MKASIAYFVLLLVVYFAGCGRDGPSRNSVTVTTIEPASSESHGAHDEHAEHAAVPALAPGQRWTADEPLRTAMQRIRFAVERATVAYEQKQLTPSDAQALAVTVEENVTYMVANCKLAPSPDAALHGLIGRMLTSAASLRKDAGSDDGVPQLQAVLRDYQATFDPIVK